MRLSGIFLLVLFYGCSKDKLKAPDAYFFNFSSVNVAVTSTSIQGTTSNKITDVWEYVNGNFKGVYPTEKMLPVVSYGPTKILLYGGIKNNGISETRLPYEFYQPIEIDTTLNNGNKVTRSLFFQYKTSTVFHWIEGFEGFGNIAGITMRKSDNADTGFSVLKNDPNVFEGNVCILMSGFYGTSTAQIESNAQFTLPLNGDPVYLEFNYKNNQIFEVGVMASGIARSCVMVNPSSTWNKIYIQLSGVVSTQPTSSQYGVYFKAINSIGGPPEIYLDNIKLLSY